MKVYNRGYELKFKQNFLEELIFEVSFERAVIKIFMQMCRKVRVRTIPRRRNSIIITKVIIFLTLISTLLGDLYIFSLKLTVALFSYFYSN